jgi:cysteine-rich repeat protein
VDPDGTSAAKVLVLAGPDLDADTRACPSNHCIENAVHCATDADCASHVCIHPVACDDVQVVPPGSGVRDPRTVVAIVATGVTVASGDLAASAGSALAQSTIAGDDLLVVGAGESVKSASSTSECEDGGNFLFCSAIKPGVDGVINSVVGGDDALVPGGSGQRRETSDPLNADTDMDLVADGFERMLGSSPNKPGDAAFGGDVDEDGLTDSVERVGWYVKVNGVDSTDRLTSNALLSDSDFDGLPDYAERYLSCYGGAAGTCSTNPNSADTDGDGIKDFDELSSAQLDDLGAFSALFPGYALDATKSAALGTDPTKTDSDGDGLRDNDELFTGWQVVRADGTVSHVLSDANNPDSDRDGLSDDAEKTKKTDPQDPDTDGDGRLDGQEVTIGSNPLRPDIGVTVTYTAVDVHPPDDENPLEWKWGFFVQLPGGDFPGVQVSDHFDCPHYDSCLCITTEPERRIPLNKSVAVDLSPGEALVLSGQLRETHDDRSISCPNGDTSVNASDNTGDRYMAFVDQPITYEQLQGGQFMSRRIEMSSTDDETNTAATVFAEISVNCAGSGKHICRTGSLCASPDDCESGNCDPDPNDSTKKRCADYCGNGAVDNGEQCDDGNTVECGSCKGDCSGSLSFPGCAGGTTCKTNADCASNSCVTIGAVKRCTTACGNGWVEGNEACDDGNTLACGSCNSTCTAKQTSVTGCAVGAGCFKSSDCANGNCLNGKCAAQCGNSTTETGEACDDGNVDACGTCNATCTATNAAGSGCAAGLSCKTSADCASNTCTAGICAP